MSKPLQGPIDFSLVQGGPLFQLFLRTHLSGDALELLPRRILVIAGVAWLPLLILSAYSGHAWGNSEVAIPFLRDFEAHVRYLVAVPTLIAAELVVHRRLVPIVRNFVQRRLVLPEELPRYHGIVESSLKVRNSIVIELLLILLVYTVGFWVWRNKIALETATWYAFPDGERMELTPAGFWSVFVAVPIFQFLLLRWYFRFFVWFSFLWRVSRLRLQVIPTHPDRTAGLGFLGRSTTAFAPVLLAQGAMLAGLIANQIAYAGRSLAVVQGGDRFFSAPVRRDRAEPAHGVCTHALGGEAAGRRRIRTVRGALHAEVRREVVALGGATRRRAARLR